MALTHADYWKNSDGSTWHAFKNINPASGGVSNLSMGQLRDIDVDKSIAWAKSQNLVISDQR